MASAIHNFRFPAYDLRSGVCVEFLYLNHAAMLLQVADVRLLSDPWLEGTAFSGGWGLHYENPDALAQAARATHLWLSHWHSDHMHVPTLKKLAAAQPDMVVLANESLNFSMTPRLRELGFRHVIPLREREPLSLGARVRVTRYPTAGIDNMLHIADGSWSVLNYNDCNLPGPAIEALKRHIGPVDVLLTNYNHAGKLFDARTDEDIRDLYYGALVKAVDAVAPRYVVPFASSHYYRSEESEAQNRSLLDFDELERRARTDPRFVIMRVGDRVRFEPAGGVAKEPRVPALAPASFVRHDYGPSVPWDELVRAATARCADLGKKFPAGKWVVKPLSVLVHDHGRVLTLRLGEAPRESSGAHDIRVHSRALLDWHGRTFGDDTFFAGAHFGLGGSDTRAIKTWALITLLDASHLDLRSLVSYLASRGGRSFLANRREEIWATVVGGRVKAGELRV